MRQANEPSVEEILDSIKKVIARDSRSAGTEPRRELQQQPQPSAKANVQDDDVLDLGTLDEVVEADATATGDEAPLLTSGTVSSISESLAALAVMAEPRAQPQIVRSGETSLEDLTRELLRPALAEWLDKNLPPLVERMVAAEIARIVGKKG